MENTKHWRQPTTTEIICDELNELDQAILRHLIAHATNIPFSKTFYHGNKRIDLSLKRGQMCYNLSAFSQGLGINRKSITKSLRKCQIWGNERDIEFKIERKGFGLIITFIHYDELIGFSQNGTTNGTTTGQRRDNEGTSLYSIKNGKSNKNEKKEYKKPPPAFFSGLNSIPQQTWDELVLILGANELEMLFEKMVDWCSASGKKYKDYGSALKNWIRREYGIPTTNRARLEKLTVGEWRRILDANLKAGKVLRIISTEKLMELKDNYPLYF